MERGSAVPTAASVAAIGARYNPVTVAGRIARIDDDLRWVHRRLIGSVRTVGHLAGGRPTVQTVPPASGSDRTRLIEQRARLLAELRHWRRIREWQIAAGRVRDHGPATISPGDSVRIRGRWHRVLGTNRRTLRIEGEGGTTRVVAYRLILDHTGRDEDGAGQGEVRTGP
ncbi:hypothetical protein [Nakamurella sp.]|uniref:hypothetical protein n=1 Tax=Nakamurella sp. TaxID=1869182 RepID=UPI003B3AE316